MSFKGGVISKLSDYLIKKAEEGHIEDEYNDEYSNNHEEEDIYLSPSYSEREFHIIRIYDKQQRETTTTIKDARCSPFRGSEITFEETIDKNDSLLHFMEKSEENRTEAIVILMPCIPGLCDRMPEVE